MQNNLTRRNFLAGSAAAAVLAGLAGCSTGGTAATDAAASLPTADKYPIEPDGSDIQVKWTSEEVRDGWTRYTNPDGGAELGVMDTSKIIQVDGLAFKDLNGNGKLDFYEDWRQSVDDRAKSLADMMSAEEIFPLLWAGAAAAGGMGTDTDDLGLIKEGSRAGVSRLMSDADSYATDIAWINKVQETCEQSSYGVPYFNYSDPYSLFNVPSSAGLAACMDKDIWRKAGMWQARAWRATGVRCDLGPQIDVYSNPIGCRLNGSVSEDPALNRDFAAAFGGGMQSTWGDDEATDDQGWGKDSCGVMLKHFVGEGCPEGGRNDHTDSGKWSVFPGGNFNAHLVPFLDGGMHLDSKTEQAIAIMPCYGIDYDPNDPDGLGEHVGSAYSEHNISILRNAGWDGMLCTDWMILEHIPWGIKNLAVSERFEKLMKNSISQHGGSFQLDVASEAYDLMVKEMGEDEALAQLRENARRIFKVEMLVQLFENPYSDRETAKEIFANEKAAEFGVDAADKCVIMLKNSGNVISKDGIASSDKVYIPRKFTAAKAGFFGAGTPANVDQCFGADFVDTYFNVVTDGVGNPTGEADDSGKATYQASDIQTLSAEDLADVKYAIVYVDSPTDAYQGVEGGQQFNPLGSPDDPYDPPVWKPISLQYRPFTADGDYVRKESLNPADEFGNYENRSVYGQSTYATNESDLDFVIDVKSRLPKDAKLILLVNVNRPMVFSEIEPYADAILVSFSDVYTESFAHAISGKVEPTGLLPYQMPKDMKTVFTQNEDVPRDMDCYTDADGNTYDFCYGLNWSGVIDDDRTKTYKAVPLTEPETEVKVD
jgi:beta-glucosidase